MSYNSPDLIRDPHREGWYCLREEDRSGVYRDPPEAPEVYWISVSPKLRLFQYPGGPALGQISQADFKYYYERDITPTHTTERLQAALIRFLLS